MKDLTNTSIIHGTHRTQDLIPAFLYTLSVVWPAAYEGYSPFSPIPQYVIEEGDSCAWWDSEDAYYLLESLLEQLNEAAPDNCYFGTHPGDGSDFGFWEIEDMYGAEEAPPEYPYYVD